MVDLELSVGDYVVSGGELPAMIVIDAVLRLLPGAIDEASPVDRVFRDGLLEYPQYTRPAEFQGEAVPEVLVSGDHGAVDGGAASRRWSGRARTGRTCWKGRTTPRRDKNGERLYARARPRKANRRPR